MLEDLRGRNVARSVAVGYPGGAEGALPGETECRFKQHDSGTIGCTGDLGVVRPEIKLNRSVPVIRFVRPQAHHGRRIVSLRVLGEQPPSCDAC